LLLVALVQPHKALKVQAVEHLRLLVIHQQLPTQPLPVVAVVEVEQPQTFLVYLAHPVAVMVLHQALLLVEAVGFLIQHLKHYLVDIVPQLVDLVVVKEQRQQH
jgi:hypothetical protein